MNPGDAAWWRPRVSHAHPETRLYHAFPMSTFAEGLSGKALCGRTMNPDGAKFAHVPPSAQQTCRDCAEKVGK